MVWGHSPKLPFGYLMLELQIHKKFAFEGILIRVWLNIAKPSLY